MFHPLGSFIPTAVQTDICLFFDNDQLHKFSLASPRTNGLFESHRMMTYKKVIIWALDNKKISIEFQDSNSDGTNREIHIDTNKEDLTEKMAILLSTCHSIDQFSWNGDSWNTTKCNIFMFNEKLIELILNIKIKNLFLRHCSISVSLQLFLKFLYRHGQTLILEFAKLPSELVSNKTLKLMSDFHVLPMEGTNLVVDVTDEFLQGNNTQVYISDFFTKFTIKGISAFTQKNEDLYSSFGILASDQLIDAIDFERDHHHGGDHISLMSTDGLKLLYFEELCVGMDNLVHFSIVLNTTDTDQSDMVPIPNNLYGIVAQESFLKFNKIFSNPEDSLPISQYQLECLSINSYDGFNIEYTIRGEDRDICIKRTDVNLKDAHKIIVEILRNCISINRLSISKIKLDEDFYHLLKPIADNIHVPECRIESTLEPESLREVQEANSGLFANINLTF